jgi:adenosylcobinamide amidohydrolase
MTPFFSVSRQDRWLVAQFHLPQIFLSWAIHGGGRKKGETVAWYQVRAGDLRPPVEPGQFLSEKLRQNLLPDAVGLLTSADLDSVTDVEERDGNLSARCVATVGLRNALRVGDPSHGMQKVGTINLLCHLPSPLTEEAHLEALSIAVEARSTAVLEAAIPSIQSGGPSTGTGTDCVVMAAPSVELKAARPASGIIRYAGKHTEAGSLIGKVVFEAVRQGIEFWKDKTSSKW